jgi:hypothetical protein
MANEAEVSVRAATVADNDAIVCVARSFSVTSKTCSIALRTLSPAVASTTAAA